MARLSLPQALSISLALSFAPSPLQACINAVHLQRSAAVKLASEVDAALERGDYKAVLSMLHSYALDEIDSDEPVEGDFDLLIDTSNPKMRARLSRARGVAYLRTGSPRKAAAIFEALLKEDGNNPYLKTRLGEARSLSKEFEERTEGKELLEELAKADLISDAEGYLALARLTRKAQREQALTRCRQMSRDPALCQLAGKTASATGSGAAPKSAPAAAPRPAAATPAPAQGSSK